MTRRTLGDLLAKVPPPEEPPEFDPNRAAMEKLFGKKNGGNK